MKLYLVLLIVSLILALLQTSALPVFGVSIDMLLVFVLLITYTTPSPFGVKLAFLSGLLLDLVGSHRFGSFTLLYTVFAFVSYLIFSVLGIRIRTLALSVLLLSVVDQLMFKKFANLGQLITQAIAMSLLSVIFYPAIALLCEKFGRFDRKLK